MKIYYSRLLLIALMCSTSVSQAMDSDEYNKRDSSLPQAKRSNQYTKKDTDKAEYPYSSREDKIENLQRYAIALAQEEEGLHPLANHNYHLAFENPAEGACYKIQNVKLNNGSKWEENVFNQGDTNTCASHAVVDILRYVHKRENIDPFYLHREAHKYFRTNEGGHSIANLMNFVQAYGVPERLPEATKTTKYAFEHFHNVYEIVKGKTKTEQIKNALLEYKHPIVISVISKVISKEGDNDLLKKNTTPIPEYLLADSLNKELVSEEKSIKKSAHAVVVYGYSDNDEGFLIKNSWGIDYVSEGKAILKYEYLNTYSNGNAYVGVGAKKVSNSYPTATGKK